MKHAKILATGLLAVALAVGCGPQGGPPKEGEKAGKKKPPHAHGKGPNGGAVFDLGKYHGEIVIRHAKKEVAVYILGMDEKTPVAIACKELTVATNEAKSEDGKPVKAMTITLKPIDEKGGKATTFVGTDPGLEAKAGHEGTVFGDIGGKPARGKFPE